MILSVYPLPLITYTHDASASFISDEGILYSYEEEKLSRFQYAIAEFPEKAVIQGFRSLDLKPSDIDHLVFTSMENCGTRSSLSQKVQYAKDLLSLRGDIQVDCVQHHLAHTALAVLTSPFEECIFLTMDAGGDGLMGHWGVFRNNEFEIAEHFKLSPAIIYAYITCLAGFSLFEEGKVMGLSSYGSLNNDLYAWLKQNFWIERDRCEMRVSRLVSLGWESVLQPELADADTFRRHKYFRLGVRFHHDDLNEWLSDIPPVDIAYTGQRFFEELVTEAVSNIVRKTSIRNLALGGGAFQNIVLNGKLREATGLKTYVSMAPHDAGLSLGAGLLVQHRKSSLRPSQHVSAYLGPAFNGQEIEGLLKSFSLSYERPANLSRAVAETISQGEVVGWFQGRAEFGARALGARSVLADPRKIDAKSKLNQNLKKRDWFMPYAPSVLEEYGHEYFEHFSPSPYMNTGFKVKPEKIQVIPSAVHTDGSCRAHTVNAQQHPKYHQLITEFYKLTGVPMVLNTSFNRHGVPIVATPRQAIQHLLEGNVDVLAIEDFVVFREYVPKQKVQLYDDEYFFLWEQVLFATRLLGRKRVAEAMQIINRWGLPIQVGPISLEVGGEHTWKVGQSEELLRSWWDEFWNGWRAP